MGRKVQPKSLVMTSHLKIIGPFKQIITMNKLSLKGAIGDEQLEVINNGAVAINRHGVIEEVGLFAEIQRKHPTADLEETQVPAVLIPGFVDCHTHIAFAGSRAKDYAMRVAGKTYLEIAKSGGGIWDTVTQTRAATKQELIDNTVARATRHIGEGVTTIEVKSGYGLNVVDEIKMLEAIKASGQLTDIDLISTCLAAHMKPKDFSGSKKEYIDFIINVLLPIIKERELSNRIDIFVEDSAFDIPNADYFLKETQRLGFDITVHADQFSNGGSALAVKYRALSADHLEASEEEEIKQLASSDTVAVVLPGASIGLGMNFAPARKLLNEGACLAIASDWNPGSAPMGSLLTQASILGTFEKLSAAETLAGLTYRAAHALKLNDRGKIESNLIADMQAYPCSDFREILYHQGQMKPLVTWKKGIRQ